MKIKNNNGSSLVLTVILMAVISIMLVGFSTAIVSYAGRINSTYYENQAYLSARSVVTAIAEEIEAISAEELADIEGNDNADVEATNSLLVAMESMTDGDTINLENISFSSGTFIEGDTTASISKAEVTDGGTTTTVYTISATSTVDGYTDTVALELESTVNTVERTTTETVLVSGGSSGSSGTSNSVTFYSDSSTETIYVSGGVGFQGTELKDDENYDVYSSGTITYSLYNTSLDTKSDGDDTKTYAKKIVIDLSGTTSKIIVLKGYYYAEEIEIYLDNSSQIKYLDPSAGTFYANTLKVYVWNNSTGEYTLSSTTSSGSTYSSNGVSIKVNSLPSSYSTTMATIASKTTSVSWPSSYPTTVSAATSATTLGSGNQNLIKGTFYKVTSTQSTTIDGDIPTSTQPIYIIVQSGKTFTVSGLDSSYYYIYLEDGAKLVMKDDTPSCTIYFGGDNCEVVWTIASKITSSGAGSLVTTATGSTTTEDVYEEVTTTYYYDYISYGLSQYVRE